MESKVSSKLWTKDFRIMIVGQFISLLGNTLQRFALSLYILDLTASAAIFSILLSLTLIPQIVLSPFGGAVADRFNKKKMMVVLDFCSAGILFIFAVLIGKGISSAGVIAVLMCLLAIIQSIYEPTVRAALPLMVTEANLTKANGVVSVVSAITSLLGPIMAGVLYAAYGIEGIFIINIVSFIFSAIMEVFLYIPNVSRALQGAPLKTFLSDIEGSIKYLIHEKQAVLCLILLAAGLNLFLTPIYTVGAPYVEKIIFGVSDELYGLSEGVMGLGMIIGALAAAKIEKKIPIYQFYKLFIMIAIVVLVMGATTLDVSLNIDKGHLFAYTTFTLMGFIMSFLIMIINIIGISFMQKETPNHMMGKIMALVTSLCTVFMPIGQIIFGFLYEQLNKYTYMIYILSATLSMIVVIILTVTKYYKMLKVASIGEEIEIRQ